MVRDYFTVNPDLFKDQIPTIVTTQFEYPEFSWNIPSLKNTLFLFVQLLHTLMNPA